MRCSAEVMGKEKEDFFLGGGWIEGGRILMLLYCKLLALFR